MTFRVRVDWDKTGDFTTVGDDVTPVVRREDRVSLRYGRDQDTAVAPIATGQGSLTLSNRDKRFSPRNTASPLYGKVRPGRPIDITRTVGATTYSLFRGLTDDSPVNPDLDSQSVSLAVVDALARFNGTTITTPLYNGIRTGDAVGYVLDALGWTGGRDLDPGATFIPWWWEDGTTGLSALDKIVKSEGPPALLTVGESGEIVFRDRHHRLIRPASLTSQGTWRDSGRLEPVMTTGFTYEESWRNIVNTGTVSVDVRAPQPTQVIWSSDSPITLSLGEQKMITVSASDPFFNAVTPVAGTDYTSSGTITVSLTRTSGLATAIILTAVGSAAVVSTLSLRANPVTVARTVQVSASDPESIEDFDPREFPNELPWCGAEDAQAVLSTTVAYRAWPIAVVSARFQVAGSGTKTASILARDLSDRVTVIESQTLLNADMYIESIQHDFAGDHDHLVTFGLEAVPTTVTPVLRFDTSGQGFDLGKFGAGVDDPVNMFRFDSTSGHRFDEGVFAQ